MKKQKKHGCFFYGCFTTIVIILLVILTCVAVYFYTKSNIAPTCNQYLSLVESNKLKEAYHSIGKLWKKQQSFEEYAYFEKKIRRALGVCENKKFINSEISANTSQGIIAKVGYTATFANGECTITFTLLRTDGKWIVEGVHYNSDAILPLLKCINCESVQKSILSKFCSKCGKSMDYDSVITNQIKITN